MSWSSFKKSLKKVADVVLPGSSIVTDAFEGVGDWLSGKKAMEEQNEANIANWNMVNAYNTPSAQMQRFMEAGLNPNLIYSQQNTASNVPGVSMPESGASILNKASSTASAIMGLKQMSANIANLRQQNENLKSQDTLLGAQADYTSAQADRYRYETGVMKDRGIITQDSPQYRLYGAVKADVQEAWDTVKDWYNSLPSEDFREQQLRDQLLRSGYTERYENGSRIYYRR